MDSTNNETVEKCLTLVLIILLVVVIYKQFKSSEGYENSYLPNYKVNVDCSGKVGQMIRGKNDIEYTSDESNVIGSISTEDSSSASALKDESSEELVKSEEKQRKSKKSSCILDKWGDDLFRFASNQVCDCNRKNGCSVCDMKYSNESDVVGKVCSRKNIGKCIVDRMENSNFDYIKGLMLGSNVY